LYASGRTTGVVLDVGEGSSHVIPVYEGYALKHSIGRSDVAGRDVNTELQLLLRKNSGLVFTTTAEKDLVKKMKEDICFVSPTVRNEYGNSGGSDTNTSAAGIGGTGTGSSTKNTEKVSYQLPDGQAVSVSSERHMAPEVLFNPSLIGSEENSVADTLVSSIMKSDIDLRPTLFTQIVLAGGTTCMPGFGDRLLAEVRSRAPAHSRIRISAPPERIHSAWAGGSILASLATFKNMWVTRAEYEEYGDSLMHRGAL
jgi:centractin